MATSNSQSSFPVNIFMPNDPKAQIVLSVYDVHGNWLGESAFASNSPNKMGNVSFPAIGSEAAGILNNQIFSAPAVIQFCNSSTSTWMQQGSLNLVHLTATP